VQPSVGRAPASRRRTSPFIGELTQDEAQGLRSEQLVEALERLWRERASGTEGIAAGKHHQLSDVDETEPLALTSG
jgi:hypothetical protein